MKLTKGILITLLAATLAVSCISEDIEDCYSINYLQFSYRGDGETEIFGDKINRVELFVFDEQNRLVNSKVVSDEDVALRTTQLPPLRAGNYHIVCIGNTHNTRAAALESADYTKMFFANDELHNGVQQHGDDSLYFATKDYSIEDYATQKVYHTETAEFASSHYDLLVEVVGVPAAEAASAPGLRKDGARAAGAAGYMKMCGVTPRTDFNNKVTGDPADYELETTYDAATMTLTARTNIMRHTNHADVNLRFYGNAAATEPLVTVNLAQFLAEHKSIDCSKHEVMIPIRIDFRSADVIVTVPEWYIQEVTPEFDK